MRYWTGMSWLFEDKSGDDLPSGSIRNIRYRRRRCILQSNEIIEVAVLKPDKAGVIGSEGKHHCTVVNVDSLSRSLDAFRTPALGFVALVLLTSCHLACTKFKDVAEGLQFWMPCIDPR